MLANQTPLDTTRFFAAKAHAVIDARLCGIPFCPVKPDAVIEHQGETYAVELSGWTGLSKTERLTVTVTRHATGQRAEFDVIRTYRTSKRTGATGVNVNLMHQKGKTPGWKGWDAAYAALVELAAGKLAGVVASNPVTGTVVLPFRVGGAA